MPSQKNIEKIESLNNRLATATGVVLLDYKGLTHRQLEELRHQLDEVEASVEITKNTLLKIALRDSEDTNTQAALEALEGPTMTLFMQGDIVLPVKKLADFMKANEKPGIKWGVVENQHANEARVKAIASLPSKEELISKLMGQIQGPLYGLAYVLTANIRSLVYALSAIEKKRGGEANG